MDYMTKEQEKMLAQPDDGLGVVSKLLEEQAKHKQITYEQAVSDFVISFVKHLEGHHGH